MKYARVLNNVVVEVFIEPNGFIIQECFTAEVVNMFEPVSNEIEVGWIKGEDGSFSAPPVIETFE